MSGATRPYQPARRVHNVRSKSTVPECPAPVSGESGCTLDPAPRKSPARLPCMPEQLVGGSIEITDLELTLPEAQVQEWNSRRRLGNAWRWRGSTSPPPVRSWAREEDPRQPNSSRALPHSGMLRHGRLRPRRDAQFRHGWCQEVRPLRSEFTRDRNTCAPSMRVARASRTRSGPSPCPSQ